MKRKAVDDLIDEPADKRQKLIEPESLLETGKAFFHGITPDIEQNYAQAKYYFEQIAEINSAALTYLGFMHEHALGTPLDMMKAFKYYRTVRLMKSPNEYIKDKIYQRIDLQIEEIHKLRSEPVYISKSILKNIHPSVKMYFLINDDQIEPQILRHFLKRFPLESMESSLKDNPHPAFASFVAELIKSGCYNASPQSSDSSIWNMWCTYQKCKYPDTEVEFFMWSLQATIQDNLFLEKLFNNFPDLVPEDVSKKNSMLKKGANKSIWGDGKHLAVMEQKLEKKIDFNRGLTFFKAMSEKNIPRELTKHILDDLQNVHTMPF